MWICRNHRDQTSVLCLSKELVAGQELQEPRMTTETTTSARKISEIIDLERFKFYQTGLYGDSFAIGTDSHLIVNTINLPNNGQNDPNSLYPERLSGGINNSVEDGDNASVEGLKVTEFADSSSRISSLLWLNDEVICLGFESGLLIGYSTSAGNGNNKLTELFQFKGSNSIVSSLKLFEDRGVRKLWILYEEGLLLMVTITNNFFILSFALTIFSIV